MKTRQAQAVLGIVVALVLGAGHAAAHPASGIAVDERGTVYFADTGRGVWRIEDDGELTLVSESAMHWMAIDPGGRFSESAESFGEWFGRLTPRGAKPTLLSCSDFPCAVGADGHLYYAHMHSLKIMQRTPEGAESVFATPADFGVDQSRPIGAPGMAAGADGALYVVTLDDDSGDHVVYALTRAGVPRTLARNFIQGELRPTERHHESRPEYCRGVAVDAQGNVYVAATGSRCVIKLTSDGTASLVVRSERPWSPTGVAAFGDALFVLEYDDETPAEGRNWPPRVRKVERDGRVSIIAAVQR